MQKKADGKWADTPVNVQECVSPQSISPAMSPTLGHVSIVGVHLHGKNLTSFEQARGDDRVVEDVVWSQKGTAHVQVLKDPEAIVHFPGGIENRIKGFHLTKDQVLVSMVAVSDDGRRLAAIAPGQGIRIYSLGEQKIFLAELASRLAVSQDGTWIALAEVDYGRIETKIHIIRLGSYFTTDHARKRAISVSVPGAIERIDAAGGMLLATVRDPDKKSARLLAYDARTLQLAYELPLNEEGFQLFGENKAIVWVPPAPDGDPSTGRFLRTVDGRAVSVVPESGRWDRVFRVDRSTNDSDLPSNRTRAETVPRRGLLRRRSAPRAPWYDSASFDSLHRSFRRPMVDMCSNWRSEARSYKFDFSVLYLQRASSCGTRSGSDPRCACRADLVIRRTF